MRWVLRRFFLVPVLAALLAAVAVTAPGPVAPAHAADASLVFAALQILTQRHVASPDPVKLLDAAVDGLRQALFRVGIPVQLANITGTDEATARREFQSRFDRAVTMGQGAIGRTTETVLQHFATTVMAASLEDSHTWFASPGQLEQLVRRQRGEASYSGFGIRLLPRDSRVYIAEVYPDGPAARAGLRAFDRILAFDGRATAGMSPQEVITRTRGTQGTTVSVTVQRPGQTDLLTLSVTHAPIMIPTIEHRPLDGSIGYIKFRQFISGSSIEFGRSLEDLQGRGMRGLVLDLRANLGGSDQELGQIASLFLAPALPIAIMRERQGERTEVLTAGGPRLNPSLPVTVLVDQNTGSAGEVLAAAFQEHSRGMVVGVRSGGRVGYGVPVPLPGGAAIVVTIRTVTTGRDVVLEKHGVRPDVVVELTTTDLDRGSDTQLQRAVRLTAQRIAARQPAVALR